MDWNIGEGGTGIGGVRDAQGSERPTGNRKLSGVTSFMINIKTLLVLSEIIYANFCLAKPQMIIFWSPEATAMCQYLDVSLRGLLGSF